MIHCSCRRKLGCFYLSYWKYLTVQKFCRSWHWGYFVGRDIGVNLPILLNAIVAELPPDGSTMLRIGMTNPPFILEHLKEIAEVLCHPCVYSFLHVPVQSGSDAVLSVSQKIVPLNLSSLWKICLGWNYCKNMSAKLITRCSLSLINVLTLLGNESGIYFEWLQDCGRHLD